MDQPISILADALGSNIRTALASASAIGFSGVTISHAERGPLHDLSQTGVRELRHVLGSHRLELTALRTDLGRRGLGKDADVDRAIAHAKQSLELTRRLAAPLLLLDLGTLPPAPQRRPAKKEATQDMAGLLILPSKQDIAQIAQQEPAEVPVDENAHALVRDALREIAAETDRVGVRLALSSSLASIESVLHALRATGAPLLGIDLDPAELLVDRMSLSDVFDDAGDVVWHVRGRDAVKGDERRLKPVAIGRGDVQWRELLDLMRDQRIPAAITIDPLELSDRAQGARTGLAQLRAILQTS